MNWLTIAWKNIWHRPLSSLLSIILFGLGVGLISFLLMFNKQVKAKFDSNLAGIDLVVGAKGSPLQLILANMYHIDAPTGNIPLKEARPFLNPKHPLIEKVVPLSLGDSHKGYRVVGTNKEFLSFYELEVNEGREWNASMEVVVGAVVASRLEISLGDMFQSSHGLIDDDDFIHDDAEPFVVVGILKPSGSVADQLILTHSQSVWDVHGDHDHNDHAHEDGSGHDHAHDDYAHDDHDHGDPEKSKKLVDLYSIADGSDESITSMLLRFRGRSYQSLNMARNINENTSLMAASPPIEITRLYSLMGVGVDALEKLIWIIGIVAVLSIFISLYQSLRQRKYELALMRVQGASSANLFSLISLEGLILAILGCVVGLAAGRLGMMTLATRLEDSYKFPFDIWQFDESNWMLIGGSLIIALIASFIPGWAAARTNVHETLAG